MDDDFLLTTPRSDDAQDAESGSTQTEQFDGIEGAVREVGEVSGMKKSTWMHSSSIIVAEIMGTGVMGLPFACARLGWGFGIFSLIFFGVCSNYSGILLARVRNRYYPHASSYSDLAREIVGPKFAKFTRVAILINWASILPYYLMAAASSLISAFPGLGLCFWQWAMLLMVLMVAPLQLRTLHEMAFLSLASDVICIGCIAVILFMLLSEERAPDVVTSLGPAEDVTWISGYGSLSSFIFAYQGHSMFLEIMREMQDSRCV
jgi:amino acid permease